MENPVLEKLRAAAAGKLGKPMTGESLDDIDFKNQEPSCEICQGLNKCLIRTGGWRRVLDHEATARYGYNYYRFRKCKMRKLHEQNQALDSVIGAGYRDASFQNCEITPDNREAVETCRTYAAGLARHTKTGLFLCGPVGTGKTYLAVAVLREAIKKGIHSAMVYVPDLVNEVKQEMHTGVNVLAGKAMNTFFLVLDDLGSEYDTNWVLESLRRLVDHRSRQQLPTVVTTNLRTDELEKIDERIYSRLRGMCERVVLTGRDMRAEKRKAAQLMLVR